MLGQRLGPVYTSLGLRRRVRLIPGLQQCGHEHPVGLAAAVIRGVDAFVDGDRVRSRAQFHQRTSRGGRAPPIAGPTQFGHFIGQQLALGQGNALQGQAVDCFFQGIKLKIHICVGPGATYLAHQLLLGIAQGVDAACAAGLLHIGDDCDLLQNLLWLPGQAKGDGGVAAADEGNDGRILESVYTAAQKTAAGRDLALFPDVLGSQRPHAEQKLPPRFVVMAQGVAQELDCQGVGAGIGDGPSQPIPQFCAGEDSGPDTGLLVQPFQTGKGQTAVVDAGRGIGQGQQTLGPAFPVAGEGARGQTADAAKFVGQGHSQSHIALGPLGQNGQRPKEGERFARPRQIDH